ncbi:MAG: 4-hydroxy-tetrahydrodipicolinate reductase [Bacteroidales bacterium]|nr:4-hydroxy-tetrahydrodipicolinate reductase [Bacteroidales bacterium]
MKIVILGYGKMGKEVESLAKEKGHQIVAKIDQAQDWQQQSEPINTADIAIDFSIPESAKDNMMQCLKHRLPLVIGTTGWYDDLEEIKKECELKKGAILWASNFSIGMNIFFKMNSLLAELTSKFPEYQAHIHEIHHTQKLDAPSGTAIAIANGILEKNKNLKSWELNENSNTRSTEILPITYERIAQVPGTHIVSYQSSIDDITMKHEAKNRKGFAAGALLAAEWLVGKTGFFSMEDVIG